jgi:peptide/nickel transport system substrate-binding protein
MTRKILSWLFVLVLLTGVALTGCGPEEAQEPETPVETTAEVTTAEETAAEEETAEEPVVPALGREPKTLIYAAYGNFADFDPASNNEQLGNLMLDATTEALVRAKAENIEEFEPALAERWEVNDDFTVWTFYLRHDAVFHDGTPVNAEAVKFSFARLINLGLGMSFILNQFGLDPDAGIVVVDDYTIEFHFELPTPLLLKALSSGYGSYVMSPTTLMEHDVDGDLGHEWLQSNEAGSGAYMLTELKPNERAVLEKFDDWWGWEVYGDGFFDKIILKVVPETASRRTLIESGEIDITNNLNPEDWEALSENPDVVVKLSEGLALEYVVLGDYGPLADPLVRQAISYAFDYEGYVDGVWKGFASRAMGPLPKNLLCHDPDVFVYETDLEKARQLLDEAGVEEGLELRYMTSGDELEVGQILQSQLAQIGVNLQIEQREISSFIDTFYGDVEWPDRPEMFAFAWWPDYNDPTDWAWVLFHSAASGSSGANAGFYSNERADEIMDTAFTVADEDELCELYKEWQDIVTRQDPAWIPTVELRDEVVLRSDIGGYRSNPLYRGTFDFHLMYREGY